ncbi:MAG: c-type cytochrome [Pseudomonadota bacterium]|nr:c-type cytochrome [Pseudomonadota bacterium]
MENKTPDREFYKIMSIMSLVIIILLLVIGYLSNVFAFYSQSHVDNHRMEINKLIDDRTQPIGKTNLESNPSIKTNIQLVSGGQSGEQVYNTGCVACHSSGAAGAPITGNKDQWRERISEGIDHLYEQAINGVGVMPAKGGMSNLTDNEVKAAVDYIIEQSN